MDVDGHIGRVSYTLQEGEFVSLGHVLFSGNVGGHRVGRILECSSPSDSAEVS